MILQSKNALFFASCLGVRCILSAQASVHGCRVARTAPGWAVGLRANRSPRSFFVEIGRVL